MLTLFVQLPLMTHLATYRFRVDFYCTCVSTFNDGHIFGDLAARPLPPPIRMKISQLIIKNAKNYILCVQTPLRHLSAILWCVANLLKRPCSEKLRWA